MDVLTLQRVMLETADFGAHEFVEVFVNGRSMREIIREVELPFAGSDLAGSYHPLTPEYLSRELRKYDQAIWILGCPCGEPGCWPLQVTVTLGAETVVWSEFQQPHRGPAQSDYPQWDYGDLRFVFDRCDYEAEIAKLAGPRTRLPEIGGDD